VYSFQDVHDILLSRIGPSTDRFAVERNAFVSLLMLLLHVILNLFNYLGAFRMAGFAYYLSHLSILVDLWA